MTDGPDDLQRPPASEDIERIGNQQGLLLRPLELLLLFAQLHDGGRGKVDCVLPRPRLESSDEHVGVP